VDQQIQEWFEVEEGEAVEIVRQHPGGQGPADAEGAPLVAGPGQEDVGEAVHGHSSSRPSRWAWTRGE